MTIHIVVWQEWDSFELIRAYTNPRAAKRRATQLNRRHGCKSYHVEELELR